MNEQNIIITRTDHAKLTELVERHRYLKVSTDKEAFKKLSAELAKASLVASEEIPPNVVTMESKIRVRDRDSSEILTFTLAWPDAANPETGHINVLAPLGMALLGCRVGDNIEWSVPRGVRRLSVEEVLEQPETALSAMKTDKI